MNARVDLPAGNGYENLLDGRSQVVVATPYRENSIVAIAQTAARRQQLARFYTTLYMDAGHKGIGRLPEKLRRKVVRELSRRSFPGIPPNRIASAGSGYEALRVLWARLLGRYAPTISTDLMYRAKAGFDSAVARRLARSETAAYIGMYAAAAESMRAVRNQGGLVAVNFVNSHPAEHNRYLRELAGLRGGHQELIPEWVSRRVDGELELADLVLVPSRFVASQMLERGVAKDRVAVIPYGVDLAAFRPTTRSRSAQGGVNCLYLGQISHRKGIPVLLEAARRCADLPVRFTLVGPLVSPEVLDSLPANVRYEGAAHPAGVPQALGNADLFILPSLEDSFGLVVLEAMASGLPVITTGNAGASEFIAHGEDGWVVAAGDPGVLAAAIRQLVDDGPARERIGEAARRKVSTSATWDAYGESVFNLLAGRPLCTG
jgi:glycosyltransferase involved in cell wall biosynthesis